MSVSKPPDRLSLSEIPEGTAEAFRSFAAFVEKGSRGDGPETLAAFEIGLHKHLMELCRAALSDHAEDQDKNGGS